MRHPVTPEVIELPPEAAAHPAMQAVLTGARSWAGDLDALPESLAIGQSTVHTDSALSRRRGVRNHMPEAFRALMRSARREVLITNAYIIPDDIFISRPARAGWSRREGAHPDQLARVARRAGGQRPLRGLAPRPSCRPVPRCTSCDRMPRSRRNWSTRRRCAADLSGCTSRRWSSIGSAASSAR